MKKRSTKLLALVLGVSMLATAGAVPVFAAQGTSAELTTLASFNGDDGTFPTVYDGTAQKQGELAGKAADDAGIRISVPENKTTGNVNLSVRNGDETSITTARTVVFDLYPNETVKSIKLQSVCKYNGKNSMANLSSEIPVNAFRSGQWNKVMFIYNPDGNNELYINNVLYEGNNNARFVSGFSSYAYIRMYIYPEDTTSGAYIDLDNIQTAEGKAITPAIKSGKYIIGNEIEEYGQGTTVDELLNNITYNGTAVTVKDENGAEKSGALPVSKGDTLSVNDGDIGTGLYYFGDAHKKLSALDDNSNNVMSNGFDDDENPFSLSNATAQIVAGTAYNKSANDKVLELTSTAQTCYVYRTTKVSDRTKVSTISFEVYPDGSWQRLDVSTNKGAHFLRLPADRLKANEWNNVTLYVGGDDKTLRPNTVYLNGKEITTETNKVTEEGKIYIHSSLLMGNAETSNQQLRIGVSGAEEGSKFVMDNFYQAEGQLIMPKLTSNSYTVDGMSINEYLQETVEDVWCDISYSGTAKIIDVNGEDITDKLDTVIGEGDSLYIYDGDFISGRYTFKTSHNVLNLLSSHIDSFDGISAVNGTAQTEMGIGNKRDTDVSMKLIADTTKANATTGEGTVYIEQSLYDAQTKSVPASTVSFEVYPNDTITDIVIAGRANLPNYEINFRKIPVSDLKAGQWNRIVFVYNTEGKNKIYLNGKLYADADNGHFAETVKYGNIRIKANYTVKAGVTPYMHIDEFEYAYGRAVTPEITTIAYGIDGNSLSGCTGTVSDAVSNIDTAYGADLVIKDSAGNELADDAQIEKGCGIYVYDGDMIIGHYYADEGKLLVDAPVIVNSGMEAGNTVNAEVTYSDTDGIGRNLSIYLAAYDENGRLTGVKVDEVKTTGNDGVKTVVTDTLTLSQTAKLVKAFVWDANMKIISGISHISKPDIICWGDSLTYGTGSTSPALNSYPAQLASLTGKEVLNMGIPNETAMSIAARMGAYDVVTAEDITIPSSKSVSFSITSQNGAIAPCSSRLGCWNPLSIGGIEGTIVADIDWDASPRKLNYVTFTRTDEGERTFIPKGTRLVLNSQKTTADWNVIFAGTNGGWSDENLTSGEHADNGDEAKLVALINDMVNYAPYPEKCVIIGLTAGADRLKATNEALAETFGDRFINAKAYFASEQSLADAGITPTEEDIVAISENKVPPSLLDDDLHFNDAGYRLMAKLVYNKLIELGFEN